MNIDLNCDLGEGAPHDAELMPLVTSANVCCGVHAGDETIVRATLRLAKTHGVKIGAHPGYDDRANFGRREMSLDKETLHTLIFRQIGDLMDWSESEGLGIYYLKPHGALYNQACRDPEIATVVLNVAGMFGLPVLALPGSQLELLRGEYVGFVREGFADRRYRSDGSLVPRSESDAMITDVAEAVSQAKRLIADVGVQSLCVHGDNPAAVEFVRELRQALIADGLNVCSFGGAV